MITSITYKVINLSVIYAYIRPASIMSPRQKQYKYNCKLYFNYLRAE